MDRGGGEWHANGAEEEEEEEEQEEEEQEEEEQEEEPRNTKGDTCSVLGLDTCTCPYHENSVISCEDDVYCQRSSSASCHPVSEWASRTFQEVQVIIIISHFFSI